MRMHQDELEIDEELAGWLISTQFPEWAEWPLMRVEAVGTDNAVFRLGEELSVRRARRGGPTAPGGKEIEWLPRLAPALPLFPSPSRRATRRTTIPGTGTSIVGSRARPCP